MMCHFWPSTGLGFLAEYLRHHGLAPDLLDLNIECFHAFADRSHFRPDHDGEWYDADKFAAIAQRYGPLMDRQAEAIAASAAPVIGFSVSASNNRWTREVARRLRRLAPERLIIFGGCDLIQPEIATLYINEADVFVIGEGEETLLEIMERRRAGRELEGIPGAIVRRPDGSLSPFEPRPFRPNLDDFPFPRFLEADLSRYLFPNVCISSSRGCIRRCTFCADQPRWMAFRSRGVESVLAEMEYHARLKLSETYYFTASLLNADLKWLDALCDGLLRRRLGWGIVTEMCIDERMSPAFFRKLRRAGINKIEYGMESGSNNILRSMNKGVTREAARRVLADTHAAGITCEINLITGFPGESEADHEESRRFLIENAGAIDVLKTVRPCAVLPGSPLSRHIEKYGIEGAESINGWRIGESNTPEIRQHRADDLAELARSLGISLAYEHQPTGLASYFKPDILAQIGRHPLLNLRKARRVLRWHLKNYHFLETSATS